MHAVIGRDASGEGQGALPARPPRSETRASVSPSCTPREKYMAVVKAQIVRPANEPMRDFPFEKRGPNLPNLMPIVDAKGSPSARKRIASTPTFFGYAATVSVTPAK